MFVGELIRNGFKGPGVEFHGHQPIVLLIHDWYSKS